jgi:hypothetical protein
MYFARVGVNCTFIELTFDTSGGGGKIDTVSMPLEIIAATSAVLADSAADGGSGRPVFMTQWNHRQWALAGVFCTLSHLH